MGHRQAWVWQDEWYGLKIDDIRQLEEETQRLLAVKMKRVTDHALSNAPSDRESDQECGFANEKSRGSVIYVQDNNNDLPHSSKLELLSKVSVEENDIDIPPSLVSITVEKYGFDSDDPSQAHSGRHVGNREMSSTSRKPSLGPECNGSFRHDLISTAESSVGHRLSNADVLKGWHMTSIETTYSDSGEDEFFDAQGKVCYCTNL